ncbi:Six-hairpin glycosidase-like protein [Aspergillus karnatakaensis]|uniref:Six-hairpin glycosidase-like protein n=1 Tax=Aspergillus karnatakaensis TaxID=1810916 RepID=UPI003CCD395D
MKPTHLLPLAATATLLQPTTALNASSLTTHYFSADAPWYLDRIPLFETSLTSLEEVYYYRWSLFRSHQRDLGSLGYLTTEFITDVGWQTHPYAILINAANYHLREARWCRDRRFKENYADILLGPQTNPTQFSEVIADGVYQGFLVDGVLDDAAARLGEMQRVWNVWNDTLDIGGYDDSKGLFYIQPLTDATEYTIASIDASGGYDGFLGGHAFRPSINSYQFANARAIASLAELSGDQALADEYTEKTETIKGLVLEHLWNETLGHFIDRFQVDNENVTYWDPIRGRELVGYVPWTHDLVDDEVEYASAWGHLLDGERLAGAKGMRTNEPSYEYYMVQYRYEGENRECQWNGPAWPYQTTQVLTGLANLLDHYPVSAAEGVVGRKEYNALLTQYAELHYNVNYGGILNLEENYDADSGEPIVGLVRSPHYFHSGFVDQVISGFVGIRPREDDVLEVNPLADGESVEYFRLERVVYHGRDVAVQWDKYGERYGTKGLVVEVDGEVVATEESLTRVTVDISRADPPVFDEPIAVSIQLGPEDEFPIGSVSVEGVDAAAIHNVIDGRVWFYPEVVNWWDTPVGDGNEIWFEVDLGQTLEVTRAEIAFAVHEESNVDVPGEYKVQIESGDGWVEVEVEVEGEGEYPDAVGNGITDVSFDVVSAQRVRLVFTPQEGVKVRLVEFKLF